MKNTLILTVIVISATLLCGCQEQQLADCQENTIQLQQTIDQQKADYQEKTAQLQQTIDQQKADYQEKTAQLQQTIDQQKAALADLEKAKERSASVTNELLLKGERTKQENKALKKEVARLKKELSRTPEERANIRKGIEQLMQLQKESAEKLIKAKEAKEAGQN